MEVETEYIPTGPNLMRDSMSGCITSRSAIWDNRTFSSRRATGASSMGEGRVREIRGRGVVGEEPVIAAGESYSYTSGCPLDSDSGIMSGHYEMIANDGSAFTVEVQPFPSICQTVSSP